MYDMDAFDYYKVLNIVAQNCVSEVSRERMSNIEPPFSGTDLDRIYGKLKEVKRVMVFL